MYMALMPGLCLSSNSAILSRSKRSTPLAEASKARLISPARNSACRNGPIAVEGAEKGDALAILVHSIVPRGPHETTEKIMTTAHDR